MDTSNYKVKINTFKGKVSFIYKSLSPEKVILLWLLLVLSIGFFFAALITFNRQFLITVPAFGGEIREGIVGTPRFINPILASSDQDEDLTSLIFAGLTKKNNEGGVVLDMAERIDMSEDGLRYVVTLKNNARFHDGKNVLADDVMYTIDIVQNPTIKSPHRIEWEGVTVGIPDSVATFSIE